MNNRAFAEVVESSLTGWIGHCWQWDIFPNAGSLVVIDSTQEHDRPLKLFGIIRLIETGSIDPTRSPIAYQKTEEELQRDHPHIFSFLRTLCTCTCAGFCDTTDRVIYQSLPRPPKIHAFIRSATPEEHQLFFSKPGYLDFLINKMQSEDFDELLLAMIREQLSYFDQKDTNFLAFFENYAHLINHDYTRLRRLTARIESLIPFTKDMRD